MSNEKYTGQNAGTQALQDFFADMASGFAVQEQVVDVEIIDLNESNEEELAEARKVTTGIVGAFLAGEKKKIKNDHTDGTAMFLHGNKIAEKRDGKIWISNAGWSSNTTKERLNGIPNVSINQKAGQWYLNGKPWDGTWIEVNTSEINEAVGTLYAKHAPTTDSVVLKYGQKGLKDVVLYKDKDGKEEVARFPVDRSNKPKKSDKTVMYNTARYNLEWLNEETLNEVDKAHAEIADHSKRSKEELDQHAQMRRERDKRLAAMGVHQKRLVKEDSLDEVSYDVTATVKGEDNVLIVSTDNGLKANKAKQWAKDQGFTNIVLHKFADLPPQYKLKESLYQEDLDEAKRKYDMSTYAISLYKAAYNLFDDGLKESDAEAAGKMLNAKAHNGYITMEDLTDIAKHFGLAVGSGLFKEGFEHADKQVEELTEADLQELFTFFKKETKPVAAVDMGGDDVTEKWTPNIESMVFGKYSFMLWKNKTKSEWYGLAYNTRNGETKKTLESSTSKSAIIKQLKAMVTGHEPVTEEVEGVDVDPKTVVEGIIEKYQTAKTKSAELVIEGLEQLIEYIAEETPPLEATSNDWSPEQETVVRGKFTLVVWKHKTKSEWYGYSYLTKTGELLVSITRKNKQEVILDLRKFHADLPYKPVDE